MIEFDLNRALFLTYAGVGAAFLVLGALVIFTALTGLWGAWRMRRTATGIGAMQAAVPLPREESPADSDQEGMNPELAAAIGTAVAMAVEAYRQERAENLAGGAVDARVDSSGWREQGRIVAFDARRLGERDR